jgi:Concanavalin A-like lectin/glucanases superfamily
MKNGSENIWRGITSKKVLSLCLSILTALSISLIQVPATFAADTTNIIGNWHLDEGRGKIVQDSSGNFNPGKFRSDSGNANDPTWIARKFDTAALRFSGQGSVEIADSPVLEPANITVEAWAKRSGAAASAEYMLSKGANECRAASYALYAGDKGGGLIFYVYDGNKTFVESPAIDAAKIWDDKWHHVAGTYDGKMVRLYVDGNQIGNGTPTTLTIGYGLPTNDKFYIGSYGTKCVAKFRGDIDEVRVWNQALTDGEITARAI